jgi:hypothetical protein
VVPVVVEPFVVVDIHILHMEHHIPVLAVDKRLHNLVLVVHSKVVVGILLVHQDSVDRVIVDNNLVEVVVVVAVLEALAL